MSGRGASGAVNKRETDGMITDTTSGRSDPALRGSNNIIFGQQRPWNKSSSARGGKNDWFAVGDNGVLRYQGYRAYRTHELTALCRTSCRKKSKSFSQRERITSTYDGFAGPQSSSVSSAVLCGP
jgi:hypothetical protein